MCFQGMNFNSLCDFCKKMDCTSARQGKLSQSLAKATAESLGPKSMPNNWLLEDATGKASPADGISAPAVSHNASHSFSNHRSLPSTEPSLRMASKVSSAPILNAQYRLAAVVNSRNFNCVCTKLLQKFIERVRAIHCEHRRAIS